MAKEPIVDAAPVLKGLTESQASGSQVSAGASTHEPPASAGETQPAPKAKSVLNLGPDAYTDPHRPHTAGERKFDFLTHVLVDYFANALISVGFTHAWKFKKADSFNRFRDALGKGISRIPGFGKSDTHKLSYGNTFSSLIGLSIPGWLILYPIRKLKDNELAVVKWFDKRSDKGRELSEQEKADREYAYAAIAAKPKQTLGTVIISRIGGLLVNWGSFLLFNKTSSMLNKWFPNKFSGNDFGLITEKFGEKVANSMNADDRTQEAYKSIISLTAYEALSCLFVSQGLKFFMTLQEKFFGKKGKKNTGDAAASTMPAAGASGNDTAIVNDYTAAKQKNDPDLAHIIRGRMQSSSRFADRTPAPHPSHGERALMQQPGMAQEPQMTA